MLTSDGLKRLGALTRSPPIDGVKRNGAPLNLKIAAAVQHVIIEGDLPSNYDRIPCHFDMLCALLRSIRLHFSAYRK